MKALSLKELKNTTGGFNDRPYGRPNYGTGYGSGGGSSTLEKKEDWRVGFSETMRWILGAF